MTNEVIDIYFPTTYKVSQQVQRKNEITTFSCASHYKSPFCLFNFLWSKTNGAWIFCIKYDAWIKVVKSENCHVYFFNAQFLKLMSLKRMMNEAFTWGKWAFFIESWLFYFSCNSTTQIVFRRASRTSSSAAKISEISGLSFCGKTLELECKTWIIT